MLLFMKTVQRLPREAGCLDEKAASAISSTGICKDEAKFSRKEPQPEEQASLTTILVIKEEVLKKSGVKLELEVVKIGEF